MKFTTTNPFTLEPIAQYDAETDAQVAAKAAAARSAFASWRRVPVGERVAMLREALRYFETHRETIANDISEQMGRPLHQAGGEVSGLFERAEHLLSIAEETLSPDELGERNGCDRRIVHEPLGVVFVISAWNYPLLITINGVLAALLAGNTVLLKHAAQTLSIGRHFAAAFGTIPGHPGLVQDIVVDHDVAGRLIREGDIDHVVFTGSVGGGRRVYEHAAARFIDCALELGGKDGAYVAADAGPKAAAEGLVDGAMFNAGQSCCGIERVYVHASLHDAFVSHCKTLVAAYVLGDPRDPATTMGPLAAAKSAGPMEAQIADAIAKGATLVCGGKTRTIGKGTYFQPTLLTGVTHDMLVMQEENFGPILPVMSVSSDDEALERINDSRYGLTCAIYTQGRTLAERFANGANTGTVFMNRCDYLDPALPWTGVNDSGKGSTLSTYGFFAMTRRKALNFRVK